MAGRLSVVCVSFLAVLAFLLLFASGTHVEATTYKMGYSSELSCAGPNKTYDGGTGDDSCVEGTYGARDEGLNADLVSYFSVPWDTVSPKYSMYSLLATMGTPSTWQISTDKEIPDGAYVGDMVAVSTLALFGSQCTGTNIVTIPLHDCSTDITDTIVWDGAISGENLTYGHEDGLPAGCLKYPQHVKDIVGDVQPRARYYGFTTVIGGMPPTQLNFMMFNPGQLSALPDAPRPDFSDDLGYINFTVLDNPNIPAEATSALDELCTPLGTTTNLLGLTGGQSFLNADVTAGNVPPEKGTFWVHPEVVTGSCVVGDCCGDGVDNNDDGRVDEMCGIVRVTNPAAGTGIYDTGSHMAGGYSESYRDAEGDTIANNEDECPYDDDLGTPSAFDHIDSSCGNKAPCTDSHPGGTAADADGDGWSNQADNCPCVWQDSQVNDADDDGIGDECDTASEVPDGEFLNDLQWGSICIEADDSDGDGWCDDTEDLLGYVGGEVLSLSGVDTSVPEYYGIDWVVNAGEDPPGAAPQSCDNWSYYDVTSGGVAPPTDDDGDTVVNADDPNCGVCETPDKVNDGCDAVGDLGAETDGQCDDALDSDTTDTAGAGTRDESNIVLACGNFKDDDADTVVNDGCPTVGDGYVNDGCPALGPAEGPGADCANDLDDDGDTLVNDGCVMQGSYVDCDANEDGDCDDSLPPPLNVEVALCYNATDDETGTDATGAESDAQCTNTTDDDFDGWRNDGCPRVGDGYANDGCPRVAGLDDCDFTDNAGTGPPDGDCDDPGEAALCANATDDDGDPDCDGIRNADDNCPDTPNPSQLDSDGDEKPGQQPPDVQPGPKFMWGGDACDQDDDNDKVRDVDEWAGSSISSDPKNVCDPFDFDLNQGPGQKGVINIMDVLIFSGRIFGMDCYPPADYSICEATYRSD